MFSEFTMALNSGYRRFTIAEKYREYSKEKIKMQMTPYKNPWTARSRSKENKRHSIRGRHEADRGRHEAERGRHEADRGRHEAELWNEDIRYMWFPMDPNSVSLG
ncbi:hypothetical protein T10_93 [Trichinella papuae]|uniref:Uncharacterized protein n=1 Tax=Trichinella papuae TaxID=268474 RepID=A0A0V1MYY1_9BILA|nr:hypothetical protein T10_93 [Trichinella papuae]